MTYLSTSLNWGKALSGKSSFSYLLSFASYFYGLYCGFISYTMSQTLD